MNVDRPYRVEPSGANVECTLCGHSREGWDIVGPDDIGLSTTFMNQEDAEELAERLNDAYEQGAKRP